jgi:hypothetical protein
MTSPKHKKSRYSKTLFKVYRLFLIGLPCDEILKVGFTDVELQKCRQFHKALQVRKYFYIAGRSIGIADNISKKMFRIFEQWQAGSLSCEQYSREKHPRIKYCFSMLLDGVSDSELNEKCSEHEIEKAKEFLMYVNADMLTSSIAKATGISRHTVKNLLKIYRDKHALVSPPSSEPQKGGIAVSAR